MRIAVSILPIAACSGDDAIVVGGGSPVNADVEALASGSFTGLAGLDDYRLYASDAEGLRVLDLVAPESFLGQGAAVRDVAPWASDRVLVLTDENLMVWDGTLRPSPIEDVLSGAMMSAVEPVGDDLWITSERGLDVWRDGALQAITIEGEATAASLAAARIGERDVVWVAVESGMVALARDGDDIIALERRVADGPAVAMSADATGGFWAAAGGRLHRRDADGVWSTFALPDPVVNVVGKSASDRVWIATEAGVFTAAGDEFTPVAGVPADSRDWTVDDIGRLVARDASGLLRASIDRPVAVRGLPDDALLFATSQLFIAPTLGDEVVNMSADLGGSALPIEDLGGGVFSATVEPAALDAGEYDLSLDVDYGGDTTSAQWRLIITNPTWENDIQPLFQERCSACHGGTTGTAVLDSPEAWELRFSEIVDRVERDNMPLGLEPLSDVQKGMIRAWGAKGFPR